MQCSIVTTLKGVFYLSCFIATVAMIGFWSYKFSMDEDLCLVDYKSSANEQGSRYPVVSICFQDPVLEEKLGELGVNKSSYLKFLRGEIYDKTMENIIYDDVTLNLSRHSGVYELAWKNGSRTKTRYSDYTSRNGQKVPYVSYSGIYFRRFTKCFGHEINDNNLDFVLFRYKVDIFPKIVRPTAYPLAVLHYPQQMLLSAQAPTYKVIWNDGRNKSSLFSEFAITSFEIVKRRNKAKDPCKGDFRNYDDYVMEQHLQEIGCRAPYQNIGNNLPICSTQKQIKQAQFLPTTNQIQDYPIPCQTVENIQYDLHEDFDESIGNEWWALALNMPDRFKEIRQSKAIDIQSLVGNAGGYIGLFLGTIRSYGIQ